MKISKITSVLIITVAACAAPAKTELTVELDTNQELIRADQDGIVVTRIRVRGNTDPTLKRRPLDLALVLDTSGSMEGAPIEAARKAARRLVERLRNDDRLAIITFGSDVRRVVPLTPVGSSREEILERISSIEPSGTTDLAGGLLAGLSELGGGVRAGAAARLVLLSDGVPNDATTIGARISEALRLEVPIAAMSFGLGADESLLSRLAVETHGSFRFVEDPLEVAEAFVAEVERSGRIVARGIEAEVKLGPGVRVVRAVGAQVPPEARTFTLSLGDVAADEVRDVVVYLATPARPSGSTTELVEVRATADAGRAAGRAYLGLRASTNEEEIGASLHPEVVLDAMNMETAAASISVLQAYGAGDAEAARRELEAARAALVKSPLGSAYTSRGAIAVSEANLPAGRPHSDRAPRNAPALSEVERVLIEASPEQRKRLSNQIQASAVEALAAH